MFIDLHGRSVAAADASRRRALAAGLLVVAANLATAAVLDHAPLKVRFSDAQDVLTRAHQLPGRPDVMFLGSSIFASLLDVSVIDATLDDPGGRRPIMLSAAVSAGDAATMQRVLGWLDRDGIRPRHIVVELAPEVLAWPSLFLKGHITRFFSVSDILSDLPEILRANAGARVLGARFGPIFLYRHELLQWLSGSDLPPTATPRAAAEPGAVAGGEPAALSPESVEGSGKIRPLDSPLGKVWSRYALGGIASRSFEALVEEASRLGIAVTLVIPPASSALRSFETPDGWRRFNGFISSISRRDGVSVVSYRSRLPDAYFTDAHHANVQGMRAFSRMFGEEVLRVWWKGLDRPAEGSPEVAPSHGPAGR